MATPPVTAGARAGVVGVFGTLDGTLLALAELKTKGYADLRVYSPVPHHELEDVLQKRESPVRLFTLIGALSGTAFGFFYAIGTSLDWELITGGKPIVSLPAYVVIGFETTILIGALSTVAGMFLNARLPKLGRAPGYDPRFSSDRFGVVAFGGPQQLAQAEEIMRAAGAEEVKDV
jgi:molybdopterin-containing oxidoreductase family membrane subunit